MKSIEIQAKTIEEAVESGLEKLGLSYDQVEIEVVSSGGMFKKAKVRLTAKIEVKPEPIKETPKPVEKKPVSEPKAAATLDSVTQSPHGSVGQKTDIKKITSEKKNSLKSEVKLGDKEQNKQASRDAGDKLAKCATFVTKLVELLGNDVTVTTETDDRAYTININGDDVGRLIGKGGEAMNALQTLVSSIAISNSRGDNKRVYVNVENYKERRTETLKALARKKAEFVKESGRNVKLEPMSPRERAIIHTELQEIEGIRTYSIGDGNNRRLVIATGDKKENKTSE